MSRKAMRFGVMLACPVVWLWAIPGALLAWRMRQAAR